MQIRSIDFFMLFFSTTTWNCLLFGVRCCIFVARLQKPTINPAFSNRQTNRTQLRNRYVKCSEGNSTSTRWLVVCIVKVNVIIFRRFVKRYNNAFSKYRLCNANLTNYKFNSMICNSVILLSWEWLSAMQDSIENCRLGKFSSWFVNRDRKLYEFRVEVSNEMHFAQRLVRK